jgi:glycosyltransferase involved in cell wall biosynthesis
MRILILTPGFAADENDHNCIPPLQILVRDLCKNGVEVHIITLEYPFRAEPYQWHGAKVYPCNGQNRKWLKFRTSARAIKQSNTLASQYKFDGLHAFWLNRTTMIGLNIAEKLKLPFYVTCMGQDVLKPNSYLINRLKKNQSQGHQVIVLSKYHEEKLFESCGLRANQQIPWGIADNFNTFIDKKNRTIDVLGVGSLLPVKNWSKWLQVIQQVALNYPKIKCTLIGDGPLRSVLEAEAVDLGISENVVFLGNIARQQVLESMSQAKALLHTANFESFCFVLLEAQANGCYLVSTPVGIAPELANTLIASDIEVLAEGILSNLHIENTFIIAQDFYFSIKQCTTKYLQLYSKKNI